MESSNPPHPEAQEARRALDAILLARQGRMPEGIAGPAETRLRLYEFQSKGPNAVTTEERREGPRVQGGKDVIGGNETVIIDQQRLDAELPGYPPGYNDGANGGILAHEGVRLRQEYNRNTENPTNAEKCEAHRNTKEALELHLEVAQGGARRNRGLYIRPARVVTL